MPRVREACVRKEQPVDVLGRWVHFSIADVHFPEPQEVLQALHGGDQLHGRVLDISTSPVEAGTFAIIEVNGVRKPLFVPLSKIEPDE